MTYFRRRHLVGDRLRLERLKYNNGANGALGNFEMTLDRRARGFRRGRWFRVSGSKGSALCGTGRLIVISLGGPL